MKWTNLNWCGTNGEWVTVPNKDISVKARSDLADSISKTEKTCRLAGHAFKCNSIWQAISESFGCLHDDMLRVEDRIIRNIDWLLRG